MTPQGDLYDPMCATHKAWQGRLFDTRGPAAVAFLCPERGHWLEGTPAGFLARPLGHGRLLRLPGDPEPADDWHWPGNAAA
jgi:hypothetical protein